MNQTITGFKGDYLSESLRIETADHVRKARVGANGFKVRPPPVQEGEQHVTPCHRGFTARKSRVDVAKR